MITSVRLLTCLIVVISFAHPKLIFAQDCTEEIEVLTTQSLIEIMAEAPPYYQFRAITILYATSVQNQTDLLTANLQCSWQTDQYGQMIWYFDLINEQHAKFQLAFEESQVRQLLDAIADNQVCEMQSIHTAPFTNALDYGQVWIDCFNSYAQIGYNTRTPESEPFWEVVDYIEEHFITPALQNPVDHWWWEEE